MIIRTDVILKITSKTITIISKILLNTYDYNTIIIYPEDIKNYRMNDEFNDFYNLDNSINKKINFKNVKNFSSFITPVPGGVGPVTVSMLLENILQLCKNQK